MFPGEIWRFLLNNRPDVCHLNSKGQSVFAFLFIVGEFMWNRYLRWHGPWYPDSESKVWIKLQKPWIIHFNKKQLLQNNSRTPGSNVKCLDLPRGPNMNLRGHMMMEDGKRQKIQNRFSFLKCYYVNVFTTPDLPWQSESLLTLQHINFKEESHFLGLKLV